MTQRTVTILKGASSAGKTTFAKLIAYPCYIITADDFFYDEEGNYNFDATKLGQAHAQCRDKFDAALKDEVITNIVIANTNTKPSDWSYYSNQAEKAGIPVFHIVVEKHHDNMNEHNVPQHVLERQAKTLMDNIKLI
jgi:predicted kinase